ncbi:bifunctional precorrin-2 dehydrogenase/sirohydrochlorin ferrochelatase [Psychromonas sp.]|uniref:precorrin-2 dehydrogenase/sirohydrochlorin ferrochelatase family protein n=1 Tax=Psychromonas sp. TaxID=1884585 RepID=UPI0035629591
MDYFPIFLDAQKLNAVVIGGGNVAARKIELLLKSKAKITVVSPVVKESVQALLTDRQITWIKAEYAPHFLDSFQLVIAATNIRAVNIAISDAANQRGMLVNVVDDPALCNYITPAIIDREPMIIALSSSGNAPILLQMLKSQIEQMLPAGYGKLARFCGRYRIEVQAKIKQFSERKLFWKKVLEGDVAKQILAGDEQQAAALFKQALTTKQFQENGTITVIKVYDQQPDNLTLQAYQKLQQADTIFLDTNITPLFFDYGRRDADKYRTIDPYKAEILQRDNKQVVIIAKHTTQLDKTLNTELSVTEIICGRVKQP